MKRGALQTILFNPLRCLSKHVFAVVIEAEHKGSIDLDAVIVKDAKAARVVGSFWRFLAGVEEVVI